MNCFVPLPLCGLIATVANITAPALASDESRRPNIILLMSDDQAVSTLGVYGNREVKTPNLDQLGRDGVVFDNYYNTTAICMASRATVMSGLYEYRHGCNFGRGPLPAEKWRSTYPVLLKQAGYLTAFAGKFGFAVAGADPADDFDFWGSGGIQSSYVTAENQTMSAYAERHPHSTLSYAAFAEDVIDAAVDQDRPFCLSISFKAPHRPWTPDPEFDDVYDGVTFTRPPNFGREHAGHLSAQSKQGRQWARWHQWGYDADYDSVMAQYHELIHGIDVAIGRIRTALTAAGLAENTIVIFTSDNGYLNGAHGYGGKVLPFEESSRAPLMIFDPRLGAAEAGRRCEALVGNIDLAPTILELAGVSGPSDVDGRSLLSLLQDPQGSVRDDMLLMNVWAGTLANTCITVLTKDCKYTMWWYSGRGMTTDEDLFFTQGDPFEQTDCAEDPQHTTKLREMRVRYDRHLARWKHRSVSDSYYKRFNVLFDRSVTWTDKAGLLE